MKPGSRRTFTMDETRLLIFRWGAEKYGVSVEDVGGVIGRSRTLERSDDEAESALDYQEKIIPVLPMRSSISNNESKRTIIMNSNGIQIGILVDEVVGVMRLAKANDDTVEANVATFQIMQLGAG
jgi:chemotaxis signal transduction protein